MRVDLTSFTDVAQHALYDPGVALPPADDSDRVLAAVPDGKLFVVDTAADGELHWCLFVDEPLPADLGARVERETPDALLRVPTGRLATSGLEYVGRAAEKATATVEVPPGSYLVDVYELDFDWDRDIVPVLEREIGAGYRREGRVGPVGGMLVLSGLVAAAIGLFSWSFSVFGAGVGIAVLGAVVLAVGLPRGDYEQRKRAIAMRFPSLVLVLRRLPDATDLARHRGAILRCHD